jgi:copper(I)-binding protein
MPSKVGLISMLLAMAGHAQAADIVVRDGWFRAMPAALPSGGYFTIRNGGGKPVTLTGVESPACGMLMMHKSSRGGMDHVMSLHMAAGQTMTFAPNGYHLMCMGATALLRPGGFVPVTFAFEGGTRVTANFQVRDARGK